MSINNYTLREDWKHLYMNLLTFWDYLLLYIRFIISALGLDLHYCPSRLCALCQLWLLMYAGTLTGTESRMCIMTYALPSLTHTYTCIYIGTGVRIHARAFRLTLIVSSGVALVVWFSVRRVPCRRHSLHRSSPLLSSFSPAAATTAGSLKFSFYIPILLARSTMPER